MESYQLYLDSKRAFLNLPVQTPSLTVIWVTVSSGILFCCACKYYITVREWGKSESKKESQSRMKVKSMGKTGS